MVCAPGRAGLLIGHVRRIFGLGICCQRRRVALGSRLFLRPLPSRGVCVIFFVGGAFFTLVRRAVTCKGRVVVPRSLCFVVCSSVALNLDQSVYRLLSIRNVPFHTKLTAPPLQGRSFNMLRTFLRTTHFFDRVFLRVRISSPSVIRTAGRQYQSPIALGGAEIILSLPPRVGGFVAEGRR